MLIDRKRNQKKRALYIAVFIITSILPAIFADSWPDSVANDVLPYIQPSGAAVTHGPILGRPGADSVRIWVRTSEPMPFEIVCETELPLRSKEASFRGKTIAENDNTGFIDITGLKPDTKYYYGIVIKRGGKKYVVDTRMDMNSEWPNFKTLPDENSYRNPKYNPKGLFNVCFGTGFGNAILKHTFYHSLPGFKNLQDKHRKNMMFYFNNGDNMYEVYRTVENRPHYDYDLFRKDYRYYYSKSRGLIEFYRFVPQLFDYDDHEVFSDLDGTGTIGLRKGKGLYRDIGLKPWYEYQAWANFHGPQYQPIRRGKAQVKKDGNILYDSDADFTSIRPEAVSNIHIMRYNENAAVYRLVEIIDRHRLRVEPEFIADEQCDYSVGTHHYFDWQISNCHFSALDCRGERTKYHPAKIEDPDQFILGSDQMNWLKSRIKNTDADFIFIFSSVPWMVYHTDFHVAKSRGEPPRVHPETGRSFKEDGFSGALVEREQLLGLFDSLEKQVLIFTGDLHSAFAIKITDNVWEFMIGPMGSGNHPRSTAGYPPYGGWFDSDGREVQIKWMGCYPDEVLYWRARRNFYGVVQVNNIFKASGAKDGDLFWLAYDSPQVVVRVHDAYSGDLVYAEGISLMEAKKKPKNMRSGRNPVP